MESILFHVDTIRGVDKGNGAKHVGLSNTHADSQYHSVNNDSNEVVISPSYLFNMKEEYNVTGFEVNEVNIDMEGDFNKDEDSNVNDNKDSNGWLDDDEILSDDEMMIFIILTLF